MTPKIGIIGGTGLGDALQEQQLGEARSVSTPFGEPSAPIIETTFSGVPVAFIHRHGVGHTINPSAVPYRANVYALKALGCTHVIASGAVGSLREDYAPRDLVLVDQFIDKTSKRVSTFFERDLVVHAEFSHPVCGVLKGILAEAGKSLPGEGFEGTLHHAGTYVCMEGPQFSTRAESLMHRGWGGDLIGMTAMPEAKLCREAELSYALVALVTDYDCWKPHEGAGGVELLQEIIGHLHAASDNAIKLIRKAIERIGTMPAEELASPAHDALKLARWTKKEALPNDLHDRFGVLLEKYRGEG